MKGKAITTLLLTAILSLGICACGKQEAAIDPASTEEATTESAQTTTALPAPTEEEIASQLKTLGDVFGSETLGFIATLNERNYTCAFLYGGEWMRATAKLPEGMYEQAHELWGEDQENELEKLLSPVEISQITFIANNAETAKELDTLIGKTGAELTAAGYDIRLLAVNGNETDAVVTKEPFDFLITFEGVVPDADTDDPAAAVADMPVTYAGIQSLSWSVMSEDFAN